MIESSPVPTPNLPSIYSASRALFGSRLDQVEDLIRESFSSPYGQIDEAARYLAASGGKRLRPLLVLLSSQLLDYRGEDDITMAAVFEIIHTATLVHDDIIDEAVTRRGRASANRVFGNSFTVLLGDFFFARAMVMAVRTKNLRLLELLAEASELMIEGEMLSDRLRGKAEVTQSQHLEIVERKTARLFSACCRSAAVLARPEDAGLENRLARFGLSLGIAFQLVDDLLDLVGDEATVGKPVASDLREGRLTLPWIDLLEHGSDEDRQGVLAVLREGSFEHISFRRLRGSLEKLGCIERTRRLAADHALLAREALAGFPDSPARQLLLELPGAILCRDR